jgi:hypothetical protein
LVPLPLPTTRVPFDAVLRIVSFVALLDVTSGRILE